MSALKQFESINAMLPRKHGGWSWRGWVIQKSKYHVGYYLTKVQYTFCLCPDMRNEDQSYFFILFIYIPVFPPKTIFNIFPTGERFSDFHKTQQTFKQLVIYHRKLENVDTILMKKILLEVSI